MNVETFDYTTFSKQEKKAFCGDEQEIMEPCYTYRSNNFTIWQLNEVYFPSAFTNKKVRK